MSLIALPPAGLSLIEASAGTGKTHAITTLVVRLVVETRQPVREILVVTFTNAAAAELRERIRTRLMMAHAAFGDRPSDDAEMTTYAQSFDAAARREAAARLWQALTGFDEAPVCTIHAFCQRTLHDLAFESLQRSDAELLSDTSSLQQEIIADFWVDNLYQAEAALFDTLDAAKVDPESLERLIADVMRQPCAEVRPQRGELDGMGEPQRSVLRFQLDAIEYAQRELDARKRSANVLSFDDLLVRLDQALCGSGGELLAAKLRKQYPVALIDEFQDTDPLQYNILSRIYQAQKAAEHGARLIIVADPKQAIYSFRGADLFAYIKARQSTGHPLEHLLVNRRSDPKLVAAVNQLFDAQRGPQAFVFPEILFRPVAARPEATDALGGSEAGKAPMRILFVPRDGRVKLRGATMQKIVGGAYVTNAVAADIARLLREAQITGKAVAASDIAVLCRTNRQARDVQAALRPWGIASVIQGDASVFETTEAAELEVVLAALAEPSSSSAVRAALATSLIGVSAEGLQTLADDEAQWELWAERFRTLHERWLTSRFMPAFRGLLGEAEVPARLLSRPDGERRMTNLLHLAELLQRASSEQRLGPLALVEWLGRMRAEAAEEGGIVAEALQIRLESDDAAVRLTTIHCSKGLEFNIVYCPYVWDGGFFNERGAAVFHDPAQANRSVIDLTPRREAVKRLCRNEMFAENMRLLYVALTRARHMCTVVWGAFGDFETAALGLLLHPPSGAAGATVVEQLEAHLKGRTDTQLKADLENLCAASNGALRIEVPALALPEALASSSTASTPALILRKPTRDLGSAWRTSSFSALTSSHTSHSPYSSQSEGQDRDESPEGEVMVDDTPQKLSFAAFPAGARTGRLLHSLLENLDFRSADPSTLEKAVAESLRQYGHGAEWTQPLAIGLAAVLDTPLLAETPALTLRQVSLQARRSEMEFIFPVAHSMDRAPMAALTRERLARCFEAHATAPYLADYGDALRSIGFQPLSGYLRGFIDLVFEHDGHFYVVDYKSNRLGARPNSYRRERLEVEMVRSHYVLQYHLYCVAVHRYLGARIANYDYDRHFGGALYLFLRGMSPAYPAGNGVFADQPPRRLIEALSQVLADPEERA